MQKCSRTYSTTYVKLFFKFNKWFIISNDNYYENYFLLLMQF